jgi:ATP-dependent Lon protease
MNEKNNNIVLQLDGELFGESASGDGEFIPIITDESDDLINSLPVPASIPILPLRNTVVFPGVIIPISIGRDKSVKLVKDAYKKDKLIGTIAQKRIEVEDPEYKDLYQTGTVAQIIKILEMPDNSTSIIIQGRQRFEIDQVHETEPYLTASTRIFHDIVPEKGDKEYNAIIESLKELALRIIGLSAHVPPEAAFALKNIENPTFLINFIASSSTIPVADKQRLLEINELKERGIKLLEFLNREAQMLDLKNDIQQKVKAELDQNQREFLLHQQMKTIQNELGGNPVDKEIEELKKKAKKKKWGKEIAAHFKKEVEKLQRQNPATGEYSIQFNYLQTLLDLPWNEYTKDNFDLDRAEKILDTDHYGLDKVKERIMEHLAVLKLKGDLKSPILCLYGPPGVGKTSLGKSIARALDRKYARVSLGGLHDEAEIRGHRKTYIGALPGRIIQNIKKVKSSNPVFVLDEIDKVGNDFRGDPSSALLEVLDPEQNNAFYDNYLELEYDLSKVMFIATANSTATIHPALLDRMELINVSGYVVEEKAEIARRHLVPKQLAEHGLKAESLEFNDSALIELIENYTRESGVRELDKQIANVIRKKARKIAAGKEYSKKIGPALIREILGVPKYSRDKYEGNDYAGVVTGLAWTPVGGDILSIETSLSHGKGNLTLTGNLGDVMKESAIIALEYIKAHAVDLGLQPEWFEHWNIHVHVPEGAIPKDGPSAGITMATSIASAFRQCKVKKNIAMTGEITLRGKVLPVGGIKEKILAAKRAGITDIVLSGENRKDIEEIKEIYLEGLSFHYVDDISDVFAFALLDEKVAKPLDLQAKITDGQKKSDS